jgi:cytochrome P450
VEEYFGCPPPNGDRLADWADATFRFLFVDPENDPAVATAAEGAAAEMRAWLDGCIAGRKAHPSPCDDVLGRFLVLQGAGLPGLDDTAIRANLLGMIVGALPTTSRCCAQALDQLLLRPEELEKARQAALAGDDASLAAYVFEALRFRPDHPGLFRIAAADYPLARGTHHGVTIPKGTVVLAATQSAMFDEAMIEEPDVFRVDRPAHVYMHFGYGLHTCFGQYINQVQIPQILKAVLRYPGVRRAPGEAGSLRFDGPYPSSMSVILE